MTPPYLVIAPFASRPPVMRRHLSPSEAGFRLLLDSAIAKITRQSLSWTRAPQSLHKFTQNIRQLDVP